MSHGSSPRVAAGGDRSQASPDSARPSPRSTCGQVLLEGLYDTATLEERGGKAVLHFIFVILVVCYPRAPCPHSPPPSVSIQKNKMVILESKISGRPQILHTEYVLYLVKAYV